MNNELPKKAFDFLNYFLDDECYLSIIVQMETLGFNFKDKNEEVAMEIFIDNATILDLNELIVKRTIAIRKNKKIDLPDAIIAATAIVYNFTLITQNTKDFAKIDGLKTINPHNL